MATQNQYSLGIDVGTECVKAAVLDRAGNLVGNAIVARAGYFQDRVTEVQALALDDAQVTDRDLAGICATGFAENCVPSATCFHGESACHALGAFHFHPFAMTVIDIGDPVAPRLVDHLFGIFPGGIRQRQ